MSMQTAVLFALDALSAIALLTLAGGFAALWRFTREPLHGVLAVAFATLAGGVSAVSASEFEVAEGAPWVDAFRMVCHTAAPLMLVSVYWATQRRSRPGALSTVASAFALAGLLTAIVWILPPEGRFAIGTERNALVLTHGLQFALYLALVVLAGRRFVRSPSSRRAFVPLAFTAYAFSKYTWVLIDLDGDQGLIPLVYFWRFAMIGLMASAFLAPFLRRGRDVAAS
jgi:hypothetical protein